MLIPKIFLRLATVFGVCILIQNETAQAQPPVSINRINPLIYETAGGDKIRFYSNGAIVWTDIFGDVYFYGYGEGNYYCGWKNPRPKKNEIEDGVPPTCILIWVEDCKLHVNYPGAGTVVTPLAKVNGMPPVCH